MSRKENESPELSFVIKEAVKSELMETRVCLPARIVSYDLSKQSASVEPLLKKEYFKDNELVSLPIINDVPVLTLGAVGGDTFIHFPLQKDDLGIIVICDRSLDRWLSGAGNSVDPADTRTHDLNDAIFIPGLRPFSGAVSVDNKNDLFIKHGNMKLQLSSAGKMKASNQTDEILLIIKDLMTELINALVFTGIGPQPFISSTVTNITAIRARLELMRLT